MQKLKICLVSIKITPDSQDGSAKFFRGIYDYLKKQGHQVTFLTGKWNYWLEDPNIIQFKILNKRFLWIPSFYLKVIQYLNSHEFDIIHGNNPKGSLPIILANKKKFISTIHDFGFFTKIPLEHFFTKYIANKASYITTCSTYIKKKLVKTFPNLDPDKIYNLYSAIEKKFEPHPQKAEELKKKLGIKGPVLIYIGRVSYYKGISDIIKAYHLAKKQIPNLNLVVGGLPDFKTEKAYNLWKQKYEDIKFVGFVPNDEIPYYYSLGDIFITYSYGFEGFGLTPIEAIACGTPVICSELPVFKEVLQNNAVFVKPKSPKLLGRAIINLLKNDQKREKLIKDAQRYISRYSWNSVGKKLEQVYQKFIYSN